MKALWTTLLAARQHEGVPSPLPRMVQTSGLSVYQIAEALVVLQRIAAVEMAPVEGDPDGRTLLRLTRRGHALCDALSRGEIEQMPEVEVSIDRVQYAKEMLEQIAVR
jgi:hypothetical protein